MLLNRSRFERSNHQVTGPPNMIYYHILNAISLSVFISVNLEHSLSGLRFHSHFLIFFPDVSSQTCGFFDAISEVLSSAFWMSEYHTAKPFNQNDIEIMLAWCVQWYSTTEFSCVYNFCSQPCCEVFTISHILAILLQLLSDIVMLKITVLDNILKLATDSSIAKKFYKTLQWCVRCCYLYIGTYAHTADWKSVECCGFVYDFQRWFH